MTARAGLRWRLRPAALLGVAACVAAQAAVPRPAAAQVDTIIPLVAPTFHVPAASRIVIPVTVDLSSIGASLGSYQGRLRFDASVLTLVSATAGTFDGEADVNVDSAATGLVSFAGANPDALLNLGQTTILQLTMDVVNGAGGERSPLSLEIDEVATAGDLTVLTGHLDVVDGDILVDPGDVRAFVRPEDTQLDAGQVFSATVWMDLRQTTAVPEAASGTLAFDPAVLRLDSVGAGTVGGEIQANETAPGSLSWAVVSTSPPAVDTLSLVVLHFTAIGGQGTFSAITLGVTDLVNGANLASLMPFLVLDPAPTVVVGGGPRLWGDANFTWRDDPTNPSPVTAMDALICLSAAVGKDVSEFDPAGCDVAPDSGATYTGRITALDALVILTYAVEMPVGTAFRVGTAR